MSDAYFMANAQQDFDDACNWYESQRAGLSREFCEAVEAAVLRIERNPKGFPLLYKDFRQVLVRRFPYALIYRVRPKRLEIEAVFHTHRDPNSWKSRARRPN